MQRVVITGGPGAGKTTLLAELARRDYVTVDESARAIIAARLAQGMSPRPEPVLFARQIFEMDVRKYSETPQSVRPVFYDRSAVEGLGMLHEASPLQDEALNSMLATYTFHRIVFLLPPWQDIFVNDAERDQSFSHAVNVHAQIVRWYQRCGYQVNEVPRLSVSHRADYILQVLSADDASL
ncbi:MAG: AAA family ATPase [Casimicrobium sp.]